MGSLRLRNIMLILVAILLAVVPACRDNDSDPAPQPPSSQPPLLITFDFHMDPLSGSYAAKVAMYNSWLDNAKWLLDTVAPYGVKISFLSAGEFMEFCNEDQANCYPVLKRLYESGGMIGTHTHSEYQNGSHSWPIVPMATATDQQIRQVWDSAKGQVENAIKGSLNVTDPAQVSAINAASMSHLPDTHTQYAKLHSMLAEYGYTIKEGGGNEQSMVALFGHVPFNVFRPGGSCELCEDLTTKVIVPPQSVVIGSNANHYGIFQDGRAPRKQVEILQALANRKAQELSGKGAKVWSYGWGVHGHDLNAGSESRNSIQSLIPWIYTELVSKGLAKFASYIEARDSYYEWEKAYMGVSSFNYPSDTQSYSLYPYLKNANNFLRYANFFAKLNVGTDSVSAFSLTSQLKNAENGSPIGGSYNLAIAFGQDAASSVDLSSIFGNTQVRKTTLDTGETSTLQASQVSVGQEPCVICVPSDCDAILSMDQAQ